MNNFRLINRVLFELVSKRHFGSKKLPEWCKIKQWKLATGKYTMMHICHLFFIYILMYNVYTILISAKSLQKNRILQPAADTEFFTSQNM